MRVRWSRALVVLIVLVSCRGDGKDPVVPSATVPTAPPQTTTTNPYAVPETIDAAYVNRVLAGLDAANGDVTRMVVATKTIPREAADRLKTLYATDELLNFVYDSISRDLANGLRDYRSNPGNHQTTVKTVITAKPRCLYVEARRDFSQVSARGAPPLEQMWIVLVPTPLARDPFKMNPVGWAFVYEGFQQGGTPPQGAPCS